MEKQVLTRDEIERDIANAIKNPPPKTQAEYRKLGVSDIVIVAVALAAFVVGIFLPVIIIWSLLAAAVLISVLLAVIYIRTAHPSNACAFERLKSKNLGIKQKELT